MECAGAATCVDDPNDDCVPGASASASTSNGGHHHSKRRGHRHHRWHRGHGHGHDHGNGNGQSGDDTCASVCSCDVILPCGAGETWDDDPTVCGCVPEVINPDVCEGVICPVGTECVAQDDGSAACEAP
jgi:hypothetical protein